jgi:hypothetical protein
LIRRRISVMHTRWGRTEDVTDLFGRVDVGTRVVVLLKTALRQARGSSQPRPVLTMLPSGRQAMNISTSGVDRGE